MIQWHTQDGNITTNHKVKMDYTLTTLSTLNVMTLKFHVDDSTKGSDDMILAQYLLTEF